MDWRFRWGCLCTSCRRLSIPVISPYPAPLARKDGRLKDGQLKRLLGPQAGPFCTVGAMGPPAGTVQLTELQWCRMAPSPQFVPVPRRIPGDAGHNKLSPPPAGTANPTGSTWGWLLVGCLRQMAPPGRVSPPTFSPLFLPPLCISGWASPPATHNHFRCSCSWVHQNSRKKPRGGKENKNTLFISLCLLG